jgi:hypothetical protein
MKTGGLSEKKDCDEIIQEIMAPYKNKLETILNTSFKKFDVLYYKTQVVAGIIYYVKVEVDHDKCIHFKIFADLQGNSKMKGFQWPMLSSDNINL